MGLLKDIGKAIKKTVKSAVGGVKLATGYSVVKGALEGDIEGRLKKDLSDYSMGIVDLRPVEAQEVQDPSQALSPLDEYVEGQLNKARRRSRTSTDNTKATTSNANKLGGATKLGV